MSDTGFDQKNDMHLLVFACCSRNFLNIYLYGYVLLLAFDMFDSKGFHLEDQREFDMYNLEMIAPQALFV